MRLAHSGCHSTRLASIMILAGCAAAAAGCLHTPHEAAGTTAGSGSAPAATRQQPSAEPPTRTHGAPQSGTSTNPSCTPADRSVSVTVQFGVTPTPVCIRTSGQLRLLAPSITDGRWQPAANLNSAVLRCLSSIGTDGSETVLCTGVRPGITTITMQSAPPTDPHGPAQGVWTLYVTVARA